MSSLVDLAHIGRRAATGVHIGSKAVNGGKVRKRRFSNHTIARSLFRSSSRHCHNRHKHRHRRHHDRPDRDRVAEKCTMTVEFYGQILARFQSHFDYEDSALVWLATAKVSRWIHVPIEARYPQSVKGEGGYATAFRAVGLFLRDSEIRSSHYHNWICEKNYCNLPNLQRALRKKIRQAWYPPPALQTPTNQKENHFPNSPNHRGHYPHHSQINTRKRKDPYYGSMPEEELRVYKKSSPSPPPPPPPPPGQISLLKTERNGYQNLMHSYNGTMSSTAPLYHSSNGSSSNLADLSSGLSSASSKLDHLSSLALSSSSSAQHVVPEPSSLSSPLLFGGTPEALSQAPPAGLPAPLFSPPTETPAPFAMSTPSIISTNINPNSSPNSSELRHGPKPQLSFKSEVSPRRVKVECTQQTAPEHILLEIHRRIQNSTKRARKPSRKKLESLEYTTLSNKNLPELEESKTYNTPDHGPRHNTSSGHHPQQRISNRVTAFKPLNYQTAQIPKLENRIKIKIPKRGIRFSPPGALLSNHKIPKRELVPGDLVSKQEIPQIQRAASGVHSTPQICGMPPKTSDLALHQPPTTNCNPAINYNPTKQSTKPTSFVNAGLEQPNNALSYGNVNLRTKSRVSFTNLTTKQHKCQTLPQHRVPLHQIPLIQPTSSHHNPAPADTDFNLPPPLEVLTVSSDSVPNSSSVSFGSRCAQLCAVTNSRNTFTQSTDRKNIEVRERSKSGL